MKITVLTYVESEGSKDIDAVVPQVARALKRSGHQVSTLAVHGDVKKLIAGLARRKPDLVFNLLEMFGDDLGGNIPVCGLLDLLGWKYTGCGPGDFYLGQDKALAKKLLAFEDILYPKFAVFSKDKDFETGGNLRLPLFVKPLRADASLGIDAKRSLVSDMTGLLERVRMIHEEIEDSALAEEFVVGREFYVGVLGNESPVALPVVEMDFSGLPEGALHIADFDAKWEEGTAQYRGTKSILADLPDQVRAQLQEVAVRAYRALDIHDYGRIDMRLTDAGEVFVLEANANCYLERGSEYARAAEAHGIEYPALIARIVELAVKRKRHRGAHGE